MHIKFHPANLIAVIFLLFTLVNLNQAMWIRHREGIPLGAGPWLMVLNLVLLAANMATFFW